MSLEDVLKILKFLKKENTMKVEDYIFTRNEMLSKFSVILSKKRFVAESPKKATFTIFQYKSGLEIISSINAVNIVVQKLTPVKWSLSLDNDFNATGASVCFNEYKDPNGSLKNFPINFPINGNINGEINNIEKNEINDQEFSLVLFNFISNIFSKFGTAEITGIIRWGGRWSAILICGIFGCSQVPELVTRKSLFLSRAYASLPLSGNIPVIDTMRGIQLPNVITNLFFHYKK